MPKYNELQIELEPFQYRNRKLCMKKSVTTPKFDSNTILTDDIFTYVDFFLGSQKKVMKYYDDSLREKYGQPIKYHYAFYWKQAYAFYKASKELPIESRPLVAYYSMLNAVKALISYKEKFVDDFITDFSSHGLHENSDTIGCDDSNGTYMAEESLDVIGVERYRYGVFAHFGKMLDDEFDTVWPVKTSWKLKKLLYNLAFVHRAYVTTYSSRNKKIQEQFLPLVTGEAPAYHKANDGNLYLIIKLDRKHFSTNAIKLPNQLVNALPSNIYSEPNQGFILRSTMGAKRYKDSVSSELKELNYRQRKNFQYIKATRRLWYLKLERHNNDSIRVNSMLIMMASMHRFSEIVRYKPEQMEKLMKSKENWLIHEFLEHALDQFIDEIASEITGNEILPPGVRE